MQKEIIEVISKINKAEYDNIYFLQGNEDYYIDNIVDKLEKNVLKDNEKALDLTITYGKEINMNKIIEYARKAPMIAVKQLIIIKEAQEIQDLTKENGKKILEHYINNPSPRTILVLAYKNKTIDKRTSLGKALNQKTNFITTKKLYDNQIQQWIIDYGNYNKLKISNKAASMIHEYLGNSLKKITKEIDKISNNLKEDRLIDDFVVQKFMGINREYNGFELQTAIANKDFKKAYLILKYFEQNPKACPINPMVALIYALFIKVIHIHMTKDKSNRNLAEILKINPYFVNQYLSAAKKYPPQKALEAIQYIHEADLKSKNINYPKIKESQIAQELVCKIMQ
ncbi:MAG: DNA polymerase III subunit delta [Bacteroidetes bacterium]|nr:DNA polymerase III subunit delta [Bacteroidota bacterium]